jgi:hypothetical protein
MTGFYHEDAVCSLETVFTLTLLYGIMFQKKEPFIANTVWISNPAKYVESHWVEPGPPEFRYVALRLSHNTQIVSNTTNSLWRTVSNATRCKLTTILKCSEQNYEFWPRSNTSLCVSQSIRPSLGSILWFIFRLWLFMCSDLSLSSPTHSSSDMDVMLHKVDTPELQQ